MATLAIQPWGSEAKALRLRSIRVEPMMNAKSQGRGFRLRIWFSSFCTLIFSWSLIRCRLWASSIFPSRIFLLAFSLFFMSFFWRTFHSLSCPPIYLPTFIIAQPSFYLPILCFFLSTQSLYFHPLSYPPDGNILPVCLYILPVKFSWIYSFDLSSLVSLHLAIAWTITGYCLQRSEE